jgi:hypothetical protein
MHEPVGTCVQSTRCVLSGVCVDTMSSFVPVPDGSDFPLNNLPFAACKFKSDVDQKTRLCVAIGEHVVDLGQLQAAGCFTGPILSQTDCFTKVTATDRPITQRRNRQLLTSKHCIIAPCSNCALV